MQLSYFTAAFLWFIAAITSSVHKRVTQISPSYQCCRCHFSICHYFYFSSTFLNLNCCKCEERVSWQSVVSCAPCNGIMPRNIRTVYEDDIIARRFFPPALARSTPFNRAISCELKSLLMFQRMNKHNE